MTAALHTAMALASTAPVPASVQGHGIMLTGKTVLILIGIGFALGWIVGRGFLREGLQRASKLQSGKR